MSICVFFFCKSFQINIEEKRNAAERIALHLTNIVPNYLNDKVIVYTIKQSESSRVALSHTAHTQMQN